MSDKNVKQSLDELKSELNEAGGGSDKLKEQLDQALENLESHTPEAIQDLIDTLQSSTEQFEVSHPKLTALMNQVMNALSGLGI